MRGTRAGGSMLAGVLAVALLGALVRVAAADPERGQALFAACAACHTDQPDALGPSLRGVVGRKAAAREDFRYSPAMQRSGLVWTEKNLAAYLRDPAGFVKGNRMPFSGLADEHDIADLIDYLRTLK